ncbi:hypothetical protein P43SY_010566 [Pythium insidiosum]|uniref:CLASP N-terminal domain-containing protein n=1 Tax=Pythium insidiosum TaxID=114742 RepID=A0AAD5LAC4_PYTIN|nr:hypothetical protein P43SY_010566 [Pythium insidiosum]
MEPMELVAEHALLFKRASGRGDAHWAELSQALKDLAEAVEAVARQDPHDADGLVRDHLLPLAPDFAQVMRSIRSRLVADACESLGRITQATRRAITPVATALLDALVHTAKGSSKAIRDPGTRLFSLFSEHARFDLQRVHRLFKESPQERARVLLLLQLQTVLSCWSKDEIEPCYSDMVDMMRRGMRDPSSDVRSAGRQAFCAFSSIWTDRLDELVDVPTPQTRDLLMKEMPYAEITKVIQSKFYASSMASKDSAGTIRQRRAEYKRQASSTGSGDQDDGIFIEVTDSSRRGPIFRSQILSSSRGRATSPAGRSPGPSRGLSPAMQRRASSPTHHSPRLLHTRRSQPQLSVPALHPSVTEFPEALAPDSSSDVDPHRVASGPLQASGLQQPRPVVRRASGSTPTPARRAPVVFAPMSPPNRSIAAPSISMPQSSDVSAESAADASPSQPEKSPDAFFDDVLPSSVPAPEPRSEANVTIPELKQSSPKRAMVLHPEPRTAAVSLSSRMVVVFLLALGTLFGISGLLQAASKVRDANDYHQALVERINEFESSILESYEAMKKMDEKYAVWNEYVREMAEEDESNALMQLQSIQLQVQRWQVEMKQDLLEFKQSLSGDMIDAALAPLRSQPAAGGADNDTVSGPTP